MGPLQPGRLLQMASRRRHRDRPGQLSGMRPVSQQGAWVPGSRAKALIVASHRSCGSCRWYPARRPYSSADHACQPSAQPGLNPSCGAGWIPLGDTQVAPRPVCLPALACTAAGRRWCGRNPSQPAGVSGVDPVPPEVRRVDQQPARPPVAVGLRSARRSGIPAASLAKHLVPRRSGRSPPRQRRPVQRNRGISPSRVTATRWRKYNV